MVNCLLKCSDVLKAKTHTAGDRDRYFADDDKFDLQTLVSWQGILFFK